MTGQTAGLPLDQYTKSTPPGWKPGMVHYPFRRFMERLKLWYRQTDLAATALGPAVAGRLAGRPFNLALALRFTVASTGVELRGDEALAFPGEEAGFDQNTGQATPKTDSGLQQLLAVLSPIYSTDAQQNASETLDTFFDLRRGRMTLLEYLNEHDYTYEEAKSLGGLELNLVGRSHFLLK